MEMEGGRGEESECAKAKGRPWMLLWAPVSPTGSQKKDAEREREREEAGWRELA